MNGFCSTHMQLGRGGRGTERGEGGERERETYGGVGNKDLQRWDPGHGAGGVLAEIDFLVVALKRADACVFHNDELY